MSRQQEQSVRKPNVEARQADTRKGSKRFMYITTALGLVALALIVWWLV
jgi:hypothetical protein